MANGLVIDRVSKSFGDIEALSNVELSVERGQMVGFLGPNGAGKTTTMRATLGLLSVDAGTITWDGAPMTTASRRYIGYMPQERGLYPRMGVREHIAYIGRLSGLDRLVANERANKWIDRVGLAERRDSLVQDLSVGNQQRVQLAVALVHEPTLLVLDEPFAGLDPVAVATLREVMLERVDSGVSVVFSSHQLDLVQDLTENVTIISRGSTLRSGTVSALRAEADYRLLEIDWVGAVPDWTPLNGVSRASRGQRSMFEVPSSSDASALIAEAAAVGSVASVRFEPPDLSEVFVDLVQR